MAVDGRPHLVFRGVGEVAERLGEVLGSGLQCQVELDLVVEDFLLEEGRENERGGAGVDEPAHDVDVAGEGAGRRHDRGAQLDAEVVGGEVGHGAMASVPSVPSAAAVAASPSTAVLCGTVRSTAASWS